MSATNLATTRVEFELSNDVIFAMKSFGQPEKIQKTLKVALAVYLLQEDTISFGKAAEIACMSQGQFRDLLQGHGIAAYEYTDDAVTWDDAAVEAYRQALQS